MDIFRLTNPTAPTKMEQGIAINGLKSKMWIERYAQGGEFTLVADGSTEIREQLPIGSFISHVDTAEIMIVENHEITDNKGENTEIVITGRGFETYLENRIVGSNRTFPNDEASVDYTLSADYTWIQAVLLIEDHILASNLLDDDNEIPFVEVFTDIVGDADVVDRIVKRGTLYSRLLEIMEVDQLGIKVIRPGIWSPLDPGSPNTAILIHVGTDRTNEVIFSYDTGEIESADYLWSNKKLKNCALVTGRWVETFVDTDAAKYDRRMMHVDASDIDSAYSEPPVDPDLTDIINAMEQRGIEALSAQNDIALTKAEVSKNTNQASYRTDFDVGDIITVHGDYDESSIMRISEYVEIEDETGRSGYPTLTTV